MVTYRLQHFPAVCVHCFGSLAKNTHSSIYCYSAELQATVDIASLQLINNGALTLRSLNPLEQNRKVPNQICKHCFDALVTFHKFRRRLEFVRKFSAGLAQLIQGNPVELIELYTSDPGYLAHVMKMLNVCDLTEKNITIEKLIEDLSSFELIDNSQKTQYTVLETATDVPSPQEATLSIPLPLLPNGIANVGVNNVNDESVAEHILPDTPDVADVPVVVLSDSEDEENDRRGRPMEAAADANSTNNNCYPQAHMVELTQGHSSALTQGQQAVPNMTTTVEQVSNRIFTAHPTQTFYCPMCTRKYKTSAGLEKHFSTHNNGSLCTVCGVAFQLADQVKTHKEIVHNIQCYFYCNICLELLPTAERLATHTARHKSPRPKECGQCLKSFPNKDYCRTHTCITYRDDYVCCGKEWAGHVYFNQHMRMAHEVLVDARVKIPPGFLLSKLRPELGGMDFYCKFCDQRLDNIKDYQAHMESANHMMHAMVIP